MLIDAAGYPFKAPLPVILLTTPVIRDFATIITPKFIVAGFVRDVYGTKSRVTRETIDRYYNLIMYDGNRKENVKFMLEARRQLQTEPVGVNTIKVSTLILWGRQDNWIPLSVMEQFNKDIPHARVMVYDGAGHIPMEEIPEITAKDADTF
jgi:pimeloyl-ACP methyl ester carboxylesterase